MTLNLFKVKMARDLGWPLKSERERGRGRRERNREKTRKGNGREKRRNFLCFAVTVFESFLRRFGNLSLLIISTSRWVIKRSESGRRKGSEGKSGGKE